jgi:hypothetical protein
MPDVRERAEVLAMALDAAGAPQDGDVVRRLLHLLDSRRACEACRAQCAKGR